MKILVTGSAGFVGWYTARAALGRGHEVTPVFHTTEPSGLPDGYRLDIRNRELVQEAVSRCDPDAVVHASAMTDVDACEEQPERASAVNVEGTRNVADAAETTEASVVFLSSAFVFDGTQDIYDEAADPNPVNHYGRTKHRAEQILAESGPTTTVVRTDQPYGWPAPWQSSEMVTWTLEQLESSQSVPVFEDWYNTPTFVEDLAAGLCEILERDISGTFHVAGPEYLNRYEWATRIVAIFGNDPDRVSPTTSSSVDLPAERPNVHLGTDKTRGTLDVEFRTVREGLEQMTREDRTFE